MEMKLWLFDASEFQFPHMPSLQRNLYYVSPGTNYKTMGGATIVEMQEPENAELFFLS